MKREIKINADLLYDMWLDGVRHGAAIDYQTAETILNEIEGIPSLDLNYYGNSTGGLDGSADIDPDDAPDFPECCGGWGCAACYEPEAFEFSDHIYAFDADDDIPF